MNRCIRNNGSSVFLVHLQEAEKVKHFPNLELGQFCFPHVSVHRWWELGLLLKAQIVLEIETLLETSPAMGKERLKQIYFGGNDVIFQTAESV